MNGPNGVWKGFALKWGKTQFNVDSVLLFASASLLIIGYIMVTSASLHLGDRQEGSSFYYPLRQFVHIAMGFCAAAVAAMTPTAFWEKTGPSLFIAGLGLLVMVLIPGLGVRVNGAVRWLSLGGVRIQVSEIVKLISVIYMAGYITRHMKTMRSSALGMLRPLLLLSFACGLLLLEPDYGSAAVIVATALAMMFVGGARFWQFVVLIAVVALIGWLLIYFWPYRMARLITFTNPWADPLGNGFQLVQALIAFGRGEWFGVGLGSSVQKLSYLPEAHTDFLFSVLAEELGLIGVTAVILFFTAIVWRAFVIGYRAEVAGWTFAAFLAYGLGIWFGLQAFINMGVNMGVLPTKGLTLPLMSYGGGSMIVMCISLALLFRVHSEMADVHSTSRGKPGWLGV
ncbi:MAG: putative lipid II flippase FtsW [Pseudomonadota bacterium]